jgi:membrane-associated phospholipid phosphatase
LTPPLPDDTGPAPLRWWSDVRRFLAARLDRGSELGLRLTVSVLLLAAGIWAFSGLLEEVLDAESLVRWDISANAWFHKHADGATLRFFNGVTQLGSPVFWVMVMLVAVWLVSRHERLLLWAWLAANFGGLVLQLVLKMTVHRSRPLFASTYLRGTSYSFPSGHTMNATIGYVMLAHVLITVFNLRGERRTAAYLLAGVIVLAVALSRLVLSVHFPSDVVGGLLAGGAWLAACLAVLDIVRWRSNGRGTPASQARAA